MTRMYNYLHGSEIYMYQRKDMFRNNTDTYYLWKFSKVNDYETLLDIGCNNGALLLYHKDNAKKLIGVDIQKEAITLANENLNLNNVENFELHCMNIDDYHGEKVDVIVCNPPYFELNNSNIKENEFLAIARHEKYLPFANLCNNFYRLLKENGRIYLVHRACELNRLMANLNQVGLRCKSIQFVYDENKDEAISVLMEIVKSSKVKCKVLKAITIKRR